MQPLGALPCIWKKAICFETQGKISAGILPSNHKKRLGGCPYKRFWEFYPSGLCSNVEHISFLPPGFTLYAFSSSWAKDLLKILTCDYSNSCWRPWNVSLSRMPQSEWFVGKSVFLLLQFSLLRCNLCLEGSEICNYLQCKRTWKVWSGRWVFLSPLSKSVVVSQLSFVENPYSESKNVINPPY